MKTSIATAARTEGSLRRIVRRCLGWAVIPYVAKKNDDLALTMIGFVAFGYTPTEKTLKRKAKYYRWCQWWGVAPPNSDSATG